MASKSSKKKVRPGRSSQDPYLAQAQLETALQLDPQMSSLAGLLAGERSDYINTRRVNASNARGIQEGAFRAANEVGRIYGGNPQNPMQGTLLAALKATANTPEGQAAYNRLAESQARELASFQNDAYRAVQAQQYGNQKARNEYMGAKDEILGKVADLRRQQGMLTAATYNKLRESMRERAVQRRGQDIQLANAEADRDLRRTGLELEGARLDETSRHNQAMEQNARRQKRSNTPGPGPDGFKHASPADYRTTSQQVGYFKNWAARYKTAGMNRAQAAEAFLSGVPANKESGRPAINAAKDPLYVTAALDIAYDGHLSRQTQKRLQQRGISVGKLGAGPSYGQWKRSSKSRPGGGVSGLSNAVGRLLG